MKNKIYGFIPLFVIGILTQLEKLQSEIDSVYLIDYPNSSSNSYLKQK